MTAQHLNRVLCEAEPRGSTDAVVALLAAAESKRADAIALTGDLGGEGTPGSEVVAELVGTYRPRLVLSAGERGLETIGRSMAVAPGAAADGYYAMADLHERTVELEQLGM